MDHLVMDIHSTLAPFTALDRCDGCTGRAKYRVFLRSGSMLQLCGHHADRSRKSLEGQGATIVTPPVSGND